jgi:hypothetical protein
VSRTAPLPSFLVFSGMPQGAAFNIAARAIDGRAAIRAWSELLVHAFLSPRKRHHHVVGRRMQNLLNLVGHALDGVVDHSCVFVRIVIGGALERCQSQESAVARGLGAIGPSRLSKPIRCAK